MRSSALLRSAKPALPLSLLPSRLLLFAQPDLTIAMDHSAHGSTESAASTGACNVSMMWNWTAIDSCFISEQWHVRSKAGFAGTVIGVFLLAVALEAFRRTGREYDISIRQSYYSSELAAPEMLGQGGSFRPFRPTFEQHAVRSTFYAVQFGSAYMLMLIGMSFNGAVILAIFVGAFIGHLISARETLKGEEVVDVPASKSECCR